MWLSGLRCCKKMLMSSVEWDRIQPAAAARDIFSLVFI